MFSCLELAPGTAAAKEQVVHARKLGKERTSLCKLKMYGVERFGFCVSDAGTKQLTDGWLPTQRYRGKRRLIEDRSMVLSGMPGDYGRWLSSHLTLLGRVASVGPGSYGASYQSLQRVERLICLQRTTDCYQSSVTRVCGHKMRLVSRTGHRPLLIGGLGAAVGVDASQVGGAVLGMPPLRRCR
ncbi:unnamed protein product [Cercospora beticola]|nr:unnamed protein product [Cercospora beticola]